MTCNMPNLFGRRRPFKNERLPELSPAIVRWGCRRDTKGGRGGFLGNNELNNNLNAQKKIGYKRDSSLWLYLSFSDYRRKCHNHAKDARRRREREREEKEGGKASYHPTSHHTNAHGWRSSLLLSKRSHVPTRSVFYSTIHWLDAV